MCGSRPAAAGADTILVGVDGGAPEQRPVGTEPELHDPQHRERGERDRDPDGEHEERFERGEYRGERA